MQGFTVKFSKHYKSSLPAVSRWVVGTGSILAPAPTCLQEARPFHRALGAAACWAPTQSNQETLPLYPFFESLDNCPGLSNKGEVVPFSYLMVEFGTAVQSLPWHSWDDQTHF